MKRLRYVILILKPDGALKLILTFKIISILPVEN